MRMMKVCLVVRTGRCVMFGLDVELTVRTQGP